MIFISDLVLSMRFCSSVKPILLGILVFALPAEAQKPRPEARLTAGWSGFIDEDLVDHGVIGGSFRYYLSRRVAVEPEVLYMIGPGTDRDITVIPNVSYDFRPGKPMRPYLLGGAGLLHQSQRFGRSTFTHNEWTGNFGVGVRITLASKLFVAPEFRIGWEPLLRFGASLGFAF
jgi:hypothetical protein